jgi:glycosyltransferase A (GT-A) superfamily protein (DUF2064 family)
MRGDRVIVFARAPRLGAVKRRLAKGIGAMGALRFYRGQLASVLAALSRDGRWRTSIAATPDRARPRWPRRLPVAKQGMGDLGARMARAMRPHRRVVVVGSDIPASGIRTSRRPSARSAGRMRCSDRRRMAATGWSAWGPRRPAHPFAGVRWSTEHTLGRHARQLRRATRGAAAALRDVDTAEDLRPLGSSGGRDERPDWSRTSADYARHRQGFPPASTR